MPIRHGGRLANRAATWPRDHFWRSTMAPRSSWPTMWNEFLPISMPTTAIAALSVWDMACSLSWAPPPSVYRWWGPGARPDHPISGHRRGLPPWRFEPLRCPLLSLRGEYEAAG